MPAARKRSPQAKRRPARKPAAKQHPPAKPEASDSEKPAAKPEPKPAEHKAEHKPASKSSKSRAYVNVDTLSWRPHPLPRGLEVSEILPKDVLEQGLADGRLTREAPESD